MTRPWPTSAPVPKTPEQAQRSLAQKRRRAVGRRVEAVVEHRLRALGLEMVERINVEQRRVGDKTLYTKRVSGDFRAVTPTGHAVLVEVKHRDASRLTYSDIQPHQRSALDAFVRLGALALLVWANGSDVAIMRWADMRGMLIAPGSSLPWAIADGEPGLGATDFAIGTAFTR